MQYFDIDKQVDLIEEDDFQTDLKFRVGRFKRWFISNIFGRALSYLVGWTGDKALMLRCTSGGILKVATTGVGFEHNKTYNGTSTNDFVAILPVTTTFSRIDIWVKTNGITFRRSPNDYAYDDEIPLDANDYYSFDASTLQLECKSTLADNHGTYKIFAWY